MAGLMDATGAATYLETFFQGSAEEAGGCLRCRGAQRYEAQLRMALQPIVDGIEPVVFAYEALVRGAHGEGAGQVLRW